MYNSRSSIFAGIYINTTIGFVPPPSFTLPLQAMMENCLSSTLTPFDAFTWHTKQQLSMKRKLKEICSQEVKNYRDVVKPFIFVTLIIISPSLHALFIGIFLQRCHEAFRATLACIIHRHIVLFIWRNK